MRYIWTSICCLWLVLGIGQTPVEEGLMILSEKCNKLYVHVDNPISINRSFDSLRFENGSVRILDSKIYVIPFDIGYRNLFLYKDGKLLSYDFKVEAHQVRPQVILPRKSHAQGSNVKDLRRIHVVWDVDYEVKLEVEHFIFRVDKKNGERTEILNLSEQFNRRVLAELHRLQYGDELTIEEVHCKMPSGKSILAEGLTISY